MIPSIKVVLPRSLHWDMNSAQRSLLQAAQGDGLKPSNQNEADQLEVLRREGYLRREEPERTLPRDPVPLPIYRLTVLGKAAMAHGQE